MNATEIRNTFLQFFENKKHQIVPSAPMVNKGDPTLMFTNAGMNQFKDFFLGHNEPKYTRIADSQKCLRVSGKHNDLEEVGRDSYHHTMFEMLGNWSFGDYFKEEAIEWAWELLTDVYGLPKERLYVTVFGGDEADNLKADKEAAQIWEKYIPDDRILYFDKKDNFWEMGETGPCGPCSEIHIDLRSDEDRRKIAGSSLVNMDNPEVIELWNLVFIQYNRLVNSSLVALPSKHVDTGMGFERLCMVIHGKTSSYDSGIFAPFIQLLEKETGKKYTNDYSGDTKSDIAFRVIVDHIRAVAFGIADGELPSNTGAGYVLRRILRRAVRYYYSFLDTKEPLMFKMMDALADFFKDIFPELIEQKDFVTKVILEEEKSFLRTLESGIKRFETLHVTDNLINGDDAFELYDTYGFPFDLTNLMAEEKGWKVDEKGFEKALKAQKERSRADAKKMVGDWTIVGQENPTQFVGYDQHEVAGSELIKYRQIDQKGKTKYQLVFNKTPFYPEGGGQVGDKGTIEINEEKIRIEDTVKENNLPMHIVSQLPAKTDGLFKLKIDQNKRAQTEKNHSATHLLHAALREVLGEHVHQKGSLVNEKYLRFDFSHFQKVSEEERKQIEKRVNQKIRENIVKVENRDIPIAKAKESGAMMLFGEKYGETVRMITFDPGYSIELCGGCHVASTGSIGQFKITSETGISSGVRRIEALTAEKAEKYVNQKIHTLNEISELVKQPTNVTAGVSQLIEENKELKKQLKKLKNAAAGDLKGDLLKGKEEINGVSFIAKRLELSDSKALKGLAYELENELNGPSFILFGFSEKGKAQLMLTISKPLVDRGLNAGNIIRELAKEIKGGGGGQPFFATAGGKDPKGIDAAIANASSFIPA